MSLDATGKPGWVNKDSIASIPTFQQVLNKGFLAASYNDKGVIMHITYTFYPKINIQQLSQAYPILLAASYCSQKCMCFIIGNAAYKM